ncbi:MAG: DUF885 domain-containing protein [Elusimicrobiaceae bacterium]
MIIHKFLLSAFIFSFGHAVCAYEGSMSDEQVQGAIQMMRMDEVFNQYLATVQLFDPEQATRYGLHGSDQNLTPRSLKNEQQKVDAFRSYLAKVNQLDYDVLPEENKIDYNLFRSKLLVDLLAIEKLQPLRRRPQYYLESVDSVYGLLTKDFGPYTQRAEDALSRLEQLPGVLSEAEQNLYHPAKIWVDKAIAQCDDVNNSFPDMLSRFKQYIGMDPMLRKRVETAVENAKKAVERYRQYLADDVMVQADGDFRAGEEIFGYYLERWHMIDESPSKIYRMMKKNFRNAHAAYNDELKHYLESDKSASGSYDDVIYEIGADHPKADAVTDVFRDTIERAYNHFDKYRILPLPKERLKILPTPEYMRTHADAAFYNQPYDLDKDRVADVFVTLPDRKLAPEAQEKILRQLFNIATIEMAVAQEAFPGRHLQDSMSLRVTRIRRVIPQPFIQNGWAAYAQYLALERGYFSHHAAKLVYLRWDLLRSARALLDVMLHTQRITYEKAEDFLVEEVGLTAAQAKAEILAISESPTTFVAPVYGRDAIIEARGSIENMLDRKFDLRDFHTKLLELGNVPVSTIESQLKATYKNYSDYLRLK